MDEKLLKFKPDNVIKEESQMAYSEHTGLDSMRTSKTANPQSLTTILNEIQKKDSEDSKKKLERQNTLQDKPS